jgi:uncharacterized protein DUF6788
MTLSRGRLWQKLIELSPLCSGSLHEQYLRCGKPECRCHDPQNPQLHGPYYLWVRRMGGKQVNRTLRPGPDLERVQQGIRNYRKFQELFAELLQAEEAGVLSVERAVEGKKNFKRRLAKR